MRIQLQLSKYHIKVTKILPISSEKSVLSLSASRGRAASRISAHQHRQTDHITQPRAAVLNGEGGTEGRKSASRAALWFCDSLTLLRSLSINTINTYSSWATMSYLTPYLTPSTSPTQSIQRTGQGAKLGSQRQRYASFRCVNHL